MEIETWKPVKGYEGLYEVSNLGSVKGLSRESLRKDGKINKVRGKILTPVLDDGYKMVSLWKSGKGKRYYVHILVAEAFLPKAEGRTFVHHKDEDRGNASVENLEWVTQKENIKESVKMTQVREKGGKSRTEIPEGEKEIWKEIDGFKGLYEVSNFGKVRRMVGILEDRLGRKKVIPERMLNLRKSKGKYSVELRKDGKSTFVYVHRLVAKAFLPNPEKKTHVSHLDGYTNNNIVFNLHWETPSEISKLKKNTGGKKAPEIIVTGQETWKDIKGYESYYQISDLGRVRSVDRMVTNGRGGLRLVIEKFMHIKLKKGYAIVRLSKEGIRRNFFVHKLVAEAFIPNLDNRPIVNHINNIKHDNRVGNLEWVTHQENIQHMAMQLRGKVTPVNQYDLNGNLLKEYPSMTIACKESGVPYLTLIDMFNSQKHMCGGYLWKKADDDTKLTPYKNPKEKEVHQYSLSGEFLHTFPSVRAAAEHLKQNGVDSAHGSNISSTCLGKVSYAHGYQWRHVGDDRPVLKLKQRIDRVVQLTMEGELVKIHNHIRDAEINLGFEKLNISGIGKACRGIQKSAHGFRWMKEEEYRKQRK